MAGVGERFFATQQLIDSIVSDPDRLLSHWCSRALQPGCSSTSALLETLIQTVSLEPLYFKVELNEMRDSASVSGNLHLFQDPNFAISLDTLHSQELKRLCVIVAAQRCCFSRIYSNVSTNTTIFGGVTQPLHLRDEQRLALVRAACIYSLFFCTHLNHSNSLQLKDMLHSVVLRVLHRASSPPLIQGLSKLAELLRQPLLTRLEELVDSPPGSRLRESLREHRTSLRKSSDTQQPRNYFLGDNWFAQAYGDASLI